MATENAGNVMREKLVERLQDIPGVASVSLDIDEIDSGIKVKLDDNANEAEVLEAVRSLLAAYGVRAPEPSDLEIGNRQAQTRAALGVDVRITPVQGGARVEVIGTAVRSFRLVPSTPTAIAQGLTEAWSQVLGRVPLEVTRVTLSEDGDLGVVATDGTTETEGHADIVDGWTFALPLAVGRAIGAIDHVDEQEQGNAEGDW
jgi:hypothetical protein